MKKSWAPVACVSLHITLIIGPFSFATRHDVRVRSDEIPEIRDNLLTS